MKKILQDAYSKTEPFEKEKFTILKEKADL